MSRSGNLFTSFGTSNQSIISRQSLPFDTEVPAELLLPTRIKDRSVRNIAVLGILLCFLLQP